VWLVKAVVFDFNGVIADDEPIHQAAFADVLAAKGVILTPEAYFRDYLGLDDRGCLTRVWADLSGRPPLSDAETRRFMEDKADAYLALIAQGVPLCPGALDLVHGLAAELPIAICSGARRREIEAVLAQADLADCFQLVLTADEVTEGKPHPSGYLRTIAELGFTGHDGLVLEDAPHGIAAAHGAGMVCVGVVGSATRAELEHHADHVYDSLLGVGPAELHAVWTAART
jgi:beta-phosphoglucomutase